MSTDRKAGPNLIKKSILRLAF